MLFKVQLVIEDESRSERTVHEVAQFKREALSADNLGLKLDEAKSLLKGIQTTLTHQQVQEYHQQQRYCSHCHRERRVKDRRPLRYHSLFGKLKLEGRVTKSCGNAGNS